MEFGSSIQFTLDDPSAMIIQDEQCKPAFTERLKWLRGADGSCEMKEVTGHKPVKVETEEYQNTTVITLNQIAL